MAQRSPRNQYSDERPGRRYDESDMSARGYRRAPQERPDAMYRQDARRTSRPAGASAPRSRSGYPSSRRRRRRKGIGGLVALLVILVLIAAGVFVVLRSGILQPKEAAVVEDTRPLPAAPRVVKTASVGATGDIILHVPILDAHNYGDGFDFGFCFSNVAPVYEQTDLMIANLEVTLGGPESGEYTGYPGFNSPDEIVPALKNAGVDICLTANNHSNDTGYYGMMRTLDVLDEYGLDHLGSRETTDEHYLVTRNVNGIRLGMLCYTYDTREYTEGEKSLNFNYLSDEAVGKIATFNYEYLDEFYADVQKQLDYMDMLNIDARIIFMHWGTEYQDDPNEYQTMIAQKLCDMGFDVIIGGHPHVIQRFDTLTGANGHKAVCLYSTGNELSNQRREIMDPEEPRGYTEDGLVMQVTFEKFNNGKTRVGDVNIIPTWVELDGNGYQIIGLEGSDPWSWGAGDAYQAIESYNRTMGRLSDAYPAYRLEHGQSEVPAYLE